MTDYSVHVIWREIKSWFTQAKNSASEPEIEKIDLPDHLIKQLRQEIDTLACPKAYQTFVQTSVSTAVQSWQKDLNAPNCLVFLGSPVESLPEILSDSLPSWSDSSLSIITPFEHFKRPRNPLLISRKIQQILESYSFVEHLPREDGDIALQEEDLEARQHLIVIPCLEQCFLRCIGGWEGIELLREIILANPQCFWIIGCHHWAWDFLNFVCQISAYFNEVKPLPQLNGEMLQKWLDPIVQTVVKTQKLTSTKDPENRESRRQNYWDTLASLSSGISRIAAHLWLESLRLNKADVNEDSLPQLSLNQFRDGDSALTLYETSPFLPSLPSLTNSDRYLLNSILIHGQITRSHLVLSLGESESKIQSRIQSLLRDKLLEKAQGRLTVQAIHYVKIKAELANNNFFVGED